MSRTFTSEYELKFMYVDVASERDKEEHILKELPLELRRKLKEEDFRVRGSKFWVRIPEPLPIPEAMLELMHSRILRKPGVKFEKGPTGYLLNCETSEGRDAVRGLGWVCGWWATPPSS